MSTDPFTLELPGGRVLTGLKTFPLQTPFSASRPLVVGVPGGGSSSGHYHVSENYSVHRVAQFLGIPFISIDRPGIRGSSDVVEGDETHSYIEKQGISLHETILPALWTKYKDELGVKSIVLMGHSIGAVCCIIASALHSTSTAPPTYPLAGITISGILTYQAPTDFGLGDGMQEPNATKGVSSYVELPNHIRDIIMFGPPQLHIPEITAGTEATKVPANMAELIDMAQSGTKHIRKYAPQVAQPVMFNNGQLDGLWVTTPEAVEVFASWFTKCPRMERGVLPNVGHSLEMSGLGFGYDLRQFGFSLECAYALESASKGAGAPAVPSWPAEYIARAAEK